MYAKYIFAFSALKGIFPGGTTELKFYEIYQKTDEKYF